MDLDNFQEVVRQNDVIVGASPGERTRAVVCREAEAEAGVEHGALAEKLEAESVGMRQATNTDAHWEPGMGCMRLSRRLWPPVS